MKSSFQKFASLLQDTFIILGVFTLLFVAANLVAMWALQKKDRSESLAEEQDLFAYLQNLDMPEARAALAGAFDDEELRRYRAVGQETNYLRFAPHPMLHYMEEPIQQPNLHIGVWNARYLPGWTDAEVEAMLHDTSRPLILLLGGSTTLGEGCADGETIAAYLQKSVGERAHVIALGTTGYEETREIDRLVYLLRHGIRPSAVLFLDGLNDFRTISRSNYPEGDKVMYRGFTAGKGDVTRGDKAFNASQEGSFKPRDFAVMLIQALPVTRYVVEMRKKKFDPAQVPLVLDPFKDKFDYTEMAYLFFHSATRADTHIDFYTAQIDRYYRDNIAFVRGLATSFGFKTAVFYQPQGVIDPDNVLRGKPPADVPGSRYFHAADRFVRDGIRDGRVPMIDISDSVADISARHRAYIDGMHYSPESNERIASIYYRYLQDAKVVPK